MKEFFRRHGLRILAAAAAVAVLLSLLTYFSSTSSVLENIAGVLTSPFRAATTAVSGWVADKRQYYEDVTSLKEENAALKKEVAELRAQQRQAQADSEENKLLRELLKLQEQRRDFQFVSTAVLAHSESSWTSSLTLNHGTDQGIAAGDRVLGLLDEKSRIPEATGAVRLEQFRDSIEFRDVSFSYDDSRKVIDSVSFTIRKGETVALVGPSGGGKSTLSELIPRFYDIQGGDILIDGTSIRNYTRESLRAHMSVVAQDTILFNDTIEGNISLGKLDATHDEIVAAAKVANAHDFIMETDKGYQTNIGDRGMKLSGGQRQRLSIARAVLKNPEILILDEATSALDTESEKLVQDALNSLLKGRTSIVIAHRLSTVHNADKIIVIDHGRIAEQGTHEELMARGGIYSKLIEMQSVA